MTGERRVVVTGIGPVTPAGVGREAFWEGITAGRSATAPLRELPGGFPVASLRSRIAARIGEELPAAGDSTVSAAAGMAAVGRDAMGRAVVERDLAGAALGDLAAVGGDLAGMIAADTIPEGEIAAGKPVVAGVVVAGTASGRVVAGDSAAVSPVDDRRFRLAALACRLALADAGLGAGDLEEAAVVLGNAVGAPLAVEQLFLRGAGAGIGKNGTAGGGAAAFAMAPNVPRELLRQLSFHSVAHELATAWGCGGRVLTVSTGCTAGLDAAGVAFDLIRGGQATIAVTGAAEAPLTPIVFAAFDLIGALSRHNDEAERASRPFDARRDGFVLAEGAAILVLEEREHALRRGAPIYAEIRGFGSLSNCYHMTNLPPDGAALARAITLALDDAALAPASLDHVNAHGSSTPQNDLCETNAVKTACGAHAYRLTVNSLKSMIGHALGASNAIELAACALSLARQYLPPTINLEQPGPGCDLDYVANRGRAKRLGHLVKLSSGFSGIHSAMVMSAAEALP